MATTKRTLAESGFEVTLDWNTSFRLADFDPYRKLSGLSLKEMDLGWWDDSATRVVFLELKGSGLWDAFDSTKDEAHNHLVTNLRDKATDVLMLFGVEHLTLVDFDVAVKMGLPVTRAA